MKLNSEAIKTAFERSKDQALPDEAVLRRLFLDVEILSSLALEKVVFPFGRHLPGVTVSGPISEVDVKSSMICFLIGVALKARGLHDQASAIESYRAAAFPKLDNTCAAQLVGIAVNAGAFQPAFEAFLINQPELAKGAPNVTKH